MGNSLPIELRERAVKAYLENEELSQRQVAKLFNISPISLARWLKRHSEGELAPKPDSGGRSKQVLFEEHDKAMLEWLEDNQDLTQNELADLLNEHFGFRPNQSSICRALKRLGWTRKK